MTDILAIIQARQNSNRLPNKVLTKFNGDFLINIIINRLSGSKFLDKIVIATGSKKLNHKLINFANENNHNIFIGSEIDVLNRFYKCAKKYKAKNILRITADCPFIDYKIVDNLINIYKKLKVDYASNTLKPHFPDGMDAEIFSFEALEIANKFAKKVEQREHVTPYIISSSKFTKANYKLEKNYSNYRITLDDKSDLIRINKIFKNFKNKKNFDFNKILQFIKSNPSFFKVGENFRNSGYNMSNGQKVWLRAKQIIPGGNMILSKRPDMFLPGKWPTYFTKTKNCKVWDLDGKSFYDLSYMGVGTNLLGYSNKAVDQAVLNIVKNGNMSTLNAKEDVILAEKLISLNPWADMVRFARSGGEANAIAIRIARAATGKDNIAVCGYHGWHDWYLSSNIQKQNNLDELLLPELQVNGVPKKLKGTVYPFKYNDFNSLKNIVNRHNIGVIKMEVMRNIVPKGNFLKKIKKLANEKNIVLIFDECTSGFRETDGGLHKKYKIEPDMAIFGKALGNGYAINAIVGKRNIMEAVHSTFISSTFWSERIGTSAAIATLDEMKKFQSWKIVSTRGKKLKYNWNKIFKNNNFKVDVLGLDAIPSFVFKSKNNLIYKTFITQEMLKNKYLATNMMYLSLAHTDKVLSNYLELFNEIIYKLSRKIMTKNIDEILDGEPSYSTFTRLN